MNEGINIPSYLLGKKAGGGGTPPVYQDKQVSITQNGSTTITKDSGYDALNSVELTVNVPQPSGKITITQNGTDIDVSSYASADVNVGGSVPTTFEGWTQKVNGTIDEFADYIKTGPLNSRTAFTNSAVTLYTPDIDCKNYFICQPNFVPGGLKYRIYWYGNNYYFYGFKSSNLSQMYHWQWSSSFTNFSITGAGSVEKYPTQYLGNSNYRISKYYYSGGYDTMEELVNAVKNDEVTYTAFTNSAMQNIPNVLYSNGCMVIEDTTATGFPFDFFEIDGIISHNETIEVTQHGA